MTPKPRLKRGLAEFAVIVTGVLVALWIDAGWGWLQDREEERELVEDLRSDFEFNLQEIERVRGLRREVLDAGARVLGGGARDLPSDSLQRVNQRMLQIWSFNPRRGALNGALQSGRVSVIRDRGLRNALAGWEGYLTDAQEEVEWVVPLATRFIEAHSAIAISVGADVEPDTAALRRLLSGVETEPGVRSLLITKMTGLGVSMTELDNLVDETQRVLGLLNSSQ